LVLVVLYFLFGYVCYIKLTTLSFSVDIKPLAKLSYRIVSYRYGAMLLWKFRIYGMLLTPPPHYPPLRPSKATSVSEAA